MTLVAGRPVSVVYFTLRASAHVGFGFNLLRGRGKVPGARLLGRNPSPLPTSWGEAEQVVSSLCASHAFVKGSRPVSWALMKINCVEHM